MVIIMEVLYLKVTSLVMKVDVLFQVTLMLHIAMHWEEMLLSLLEKAQQVTCHVYETYQIPILKIGKLQVVHFPL